MNSAMTLRGPGHRPCVMIADDDLFIRELLKRQLPDDCEFIEASDGAHVLEAYKKTLPNIVYLDLHMPNQDAPRILKDIAAFDPDAYIVVMTSDNTRENIAASVIAGAKCFLAKPLESKRIVAEYDKAIAATRRPS